MKKMQQKEKQPQTLKQRLMSALAMLLVSSLLMTTTSYAWFVLSTAPEVTGIETQVGANGSLEIALLNTQTRENMSLIRSGLGDSLAADNATANNTWGNLIDLSYRDYGLGKILLMPSRLSVSGNATSGYTVDMSKPLQIPNYGYDGRVIDLTDNTLSAIYQNGDFAYTTGVQDYGVRAIGTSDMVTVQICALSAAKGNIPTYTKSAKNNAQSVLGSNTDAIFNIMMSHKTSGGSETYTNEDRDALNTLLRGLQKSVSDIDAAMRQGLVAYAASKLSDETQFDNAKNQILDTSKSLESLLTSVSGLSSIPAEFNKWVADLSAMQQELNAALAACQEMTSGVYTWTDIRGVLDCVMNTEFVRSGDDLFADVTEDKLMELIRAGNGITMTLAPGSGAFDSIADFAGNIESSMEMYGATILIQTASAQTPKYLEALAAVVNELNAAAGGSASVAFPLSATYGYALDFAFRCNVDNPDLVLQTYGTQRVYSDSDSTSTLGGGSYMKFGSSDTNLDRNARIKLMDAIRVGFLDDQGKLLSVGKLNIQNVAEEDGMLKAYLYLYEYSFSKEDGSMVMGERRTTDNLITADMQRNVAKALTVVVWLDGDLVDNSMVSAKEAASLSGVLNLQFATTAELIPASDGKLLSYTADANGLTTLVDEYKAPFEAGQGTYTNVSWNAFAAAYQTSVTVSANENAGAVEVASAVRNLSKAYAALENVSKDALNTLIRTYRAIVGTSDEIHGYVVDNGDGTVKLMGNEEHTQKEHDSWKDKTKATIYRVDYNKNLKDEGNDLYTRVYSDETWNAMAAALYNAEMIFADPYASEDEVNAAMTALTNANKAMSFQVFFKPYAYRGELYYEAICDAENEDTYGKWYDSNFKRILSEITMLNLDAYAEPVVITELGQNTYVPSDAGYITPNVAFLEAVYPELRNVEIKGIRWNELDTEFFVELMTQEQYTKLLELVQMCDNDGSLNTNPSERLTAAKEAATDLLNKYNVKVDVKADDASEAIAELNAAIIEQMEAANAGKPTPMTANQLTLLNAAINAADKVASDVENYDVLDAAQAAAQTLVNKPEATAAEATEALAKLNAELVKAGAEGISEYNTLTHKLPADGFGTEDVIYSAVDYPGVQLKLTGKSGTTTISVSVLTEDGVVAEMSKQITIYDKVDAVYVENIQVEDFDFITLDVYGADHAKTEKLESALWYYTLADAEGNPVDPEGKPVTDGKTYHATTGKLMSELLKEEAVTTTYGSTNPKVATVSIDGLITAVGKGETEISVSIATNAGNTYVCRFKVVVVDTTPETPAGP